MPTDHVSEWLAPVSIKLDMLHVSIYVPQWEILDQACKLATLRNMPSLATLHPNLSCEGVTSGGGHALARLREALQLRTLRLHVDSNQLVAQLGGTAAAKYRVHKAACSCCQARWQAQSSPYGPGKSTGKLCTSHRACLIWPWV
mmetsp:Transcript_152689/g.266628  ORF Transcript_152689/g.266628 Transcript_152689/m.266628 type:complete len:144 (+) Transcript_152689:526-957(+)